jgi:hypothetical protein
MAARIRPETYCTGWVSEMVCRFIGTGMGSEGLVGSQIMDYGEGGIERKSRVFR